MIDKAREIALKILYKIDNENAYSNLALDESLRQNNKILNEKDIGLISQIVYGVTNWKLTLDCIIQKYSKIKLKKISPWIINILRMGIYQIIFLDKIPKSAAVDESVNLAKRYGHKSSSGFVNAILRKISKDDYYELFKINNIKERISKTQSMPKWLVEKLFCNYNVEEVEEICKYLNENPEISIRINKLKTNKDELIEKISKNKIEIKQAELEDFLILSKVKNIDKMEEFKEGLFTVQDESAGLAALILNPKKGDKVLDACSAPGGKTTHLAEIMENEGEIFAWDIYEHRLKLIENNCKRLGITIVNVKKQRAEEKDNSNNLYDKILLDVPCMGIGVIKKKPDIKWQREYENIENITKLQLQILQNCSKLLKKGGELVYSTCSILKEENEEVINKFLQENTNFDIITKDEVEKFPSFKKYLVDEKYLRILPNSEHDGFFICKMKNKKD